MKDKVRHPSLSGIEKIIRTLELVLPQAKSVEDSCYESIDMSNSQVNNKNECGTPMCHAGWYAFSINKSENRKIRSYCSGAKLMARELGFRNIQQIKDWARENSDIWGNDNGVLMFVDISAFGNYSKVNYTLGTIIDHWRGVADRLQNCLNKID